MPSSVAKLKRWRSSFAPATFARARKSGSAVSQAPSAQVRCPYRSFSARGLKSSIVFPSDGSASRSSRSTCEGAPDVVAPGRSITQRSGFPSISPPMRRASPRSSSRCQSASAVFERSARAADCSGCPYFSSSASFIRVYIAAPTPLPRSEPSRATRPTPKVPSSFLNAEISPPPPLDDSTWRISRSGFPSPAGSSSSFVEAPCCTSRSSAEVGRAADSGAMPDADPRLPTAVPSSIIPRRMISCAGTPSAGAPLARNTRVS